MEDLSCSNPLTGHFMLLNLSPPKLQQSQRHCQLFNNQQSIRLPLSSTQYLKSTCWLAPPRGRVKSFAFGIRTNYNVNDRQTKQHAVVDDEAFDTKHICTTSEEAPTISNAQLSLITDAHCDHGHEGNAYMDTSRMLLSASEMLPFLNDSNTQEDYIHTHSDTIQTQSKERLLKRKSQQLTYLFAALASSIGIASLAGASVYYRFAWQMEGGEVSWTEMFGTFSLALGAAVGMEYWARWAHRALWHASLWSMHESHHQSRDGPFELNDIFAIINAVPAIALMAFGFLHKGLMPGLCFGAGLGITVFGIAYMFVHDGLVHRRFPVGPIAEVPYFQKVAAAHQLHHAEKFNGVPYGLFLGPMELEEVGGRTELEKVLQKRKREKTNPINS